MMMPVSLTPKILAFDTSSVRGSVALLDGTELRAELRLNSLQTHSALLLSSIDFLLGRAGWTLGDLSLVAVGIGPGSFTGIRIGIATALGFAQTLEIPFAGISGLDALVHHCTFPDGYVGAVLDAHRSQVYYGEYICRHGRIRQSKKPCLFTISELERRLADRHTYIVGDLKACLPHAQKHSPAEWPRPVPADLFLAASIGRLALLRKRSWRLGDTIIAEPMYIRPPDAIKNKGKKR
jgi:tRNA threonylcarbamoyladenosine biosynthesis protein TsaB